MDSFYPVFPSREFPHLAAHTVTFVLVTTTCQLKFAVFAFQFHSSLAFYKAIFLCFLQLRTCLFIIIFKHQDQTVSTAKRIYLVGLVLFKKVRTLYVNLSSGKITFVIILVPSTKLVLNTLVYSFSNPLFSLIILKGALRFLMFLYFVGLFELLRSIRTLSFWRGIFCPMGLLNWLLNT